MKYLQSYDKFLYEKKTNKLKSITKQVFDDYKVNIYFVTTFGTSIAFFIPLIERLLYNSEHYNITSYDISLLLIFCIAELVNYKDGSINEIKKSINEKGLTTLISKVKNNIKSIFKIISKLSKDFGHLIEKLIDMFAYTNILLPFLQIMTEIISEDGININNLPYKLLGLGIGAGSLYIKYLINKIRKKIK